MPRTLAVLTLLLTAAPAVCQWKEWTYDFDKGIAQAKRKHKDVLVIFHGPAYGAPSSTMTLLPSNYDFIHQAERGHVLVRVILPRGTERSTAIPNPKRNREVAEEYVW
jgi:hypothetical protein